MANTSLGKLIRGALDGRLAGLHVAVPGKVVSYDAATQRCSVAPMSSIRVGENEVPLPVIEDVPVAWPRAGGCTIVLPIAVGDVVEVRFYDRALDDWRGTGEQVAPSDPRAHALTDAVVFPAGVWPDALPSPTAALAGDDIVIARDGGGCIAIKPDGSVVLGDVVAGVVAQPVASAPLVDAQLAALKVALVPFSLVPVVVTPVETAAAVNIIMAALKVLFATGWPTSTATTKTRAV